MNDTSYLEPTKPTYAYYGYVNYDLAEFVIRHSINLMYINEEDAMLMKLKFKLTDQLLIKYKNHYK